MEIDEELNKKALEFLVKTPKAMLFCIFSFFSGQLWVFIIITYLKKTKKGNKYLDKFYSKLGIGSFWFLVISSPFYIQKYHVFNFDFLKFLDIFCNTLMLAVFLQLLVFILVISLAKERRNV